MQRAALLILVLMSGIAYADTEQSGIDAVSHSTDSSAVFPAIEGETQKSVAGFGGLVILTPDQDWEKKWKTPGVPPHFLRASSVKRGGELYILTMFTNPKQDEHRAANVTVDIDVRRPDGSSATHSEGAKCYKGKLLGPPDHVFICAPMVNFVGEDSDPAGTWSVRITVTDEIRNVSIPLATSFVLLDEKVSP